jgi:hypothetical protein
VSATVSTASVPVVVSRIRTLPWLVYLIALDTRFVTIVDHIARSTGTVIGPSGASTWNVRPACPAAARNML